MRVSHTSNTARSRRKAKKRQSLLKLCLSLAFAAILCVGVYAAVSTALSHTGKIPVDSSSSSIASAPILSKDSDTGAEKAKDSGKTFDLTAILGRAAVTEKEPLPNSDEKLIALTFDDGPSADSVAFVEELNALGVRCTFFMQGYLIEAYPDAAKAMVAGGHQIASHTYDHPNLATSSNSTVMEQIDKTEALLSAVDGKENHYLRCPYGESSDFVRNYVKHPSSTGALILRIGAHLTARPCVKALSQTLMTALLFLPMRFMKQAAPAPLMPLKSCRHRDIRS